MNSPTPETISKTQRWLDLIAYLAGRRVPVVVEELMEQIPAYTRAWLGGDATARAGARRMFERDKDELRSLGIPLETVEYTISYGNERVEGYRLSRRDFYLPYLRLLAEGGEAEPAARGLAGEVQLSAAEARLALDALDHVADLPAFPFAREARSAFRKLSFDLRPDRFAAAPVLWLERPGTEELLERVRTIGDALLARKRLRFTYHGIYRGETTEREVEGYGLYFQRDWYLAGHDLQREALRVFRVGRMEALVPNRKAPKQPDYEIPSNFRLADHLVRRAWELGHAAPVAAEVRLRFPAALLVEKEGAGELVRRDEDGAAVLRFAVQQVDPFLRWILSYGGEAEILGPPELAEALREMSRGVAALYADAEPDA
jgi:proteasome accessory factor B